MLANIRTTATRADFARAAVEGVLCGLLEGGDVLARHGVTGSGRLILTGGAARSRAYRQVLADLTGRTVWTCPMIEAAAAGAAVQAAAALTGAPVSDIAEAWAPSLEIGAEPHPQSKQSAGIVRQAYRRAATETALGRPA